MAYDEALAARIRSAVDGLPVTEKKMFGGLSFLINGNMACGVLGEELIVRVGSERHADLVLHPETRPMDFTGRPMKGWLFVSAAGVAADVDLAHWVQQGVDYALSLPPK